MTTCIFYHDPCPDGLAAAWVFRQQYGNDAEYIPITYGKPIPDVTGKDVIAVDFAFSVEDTQRIEQQAKSLLVLDHHVTSQNKFKGYQCLCHSTKLHFDMNHSGAMLAWNYLNGNAPAPWFIQHIEDEDLWSWKLEDSRGFSTKRQSLPLTFETMDQLNGMNASEQAAFIAEGNAWWAYHMALVHKSVADARPIVVDGVAGLQISCPYFLRNEVGNELAKKSGTFGLIWNIEPNQLIKFSLRSEQFDVSELALRFSGGGHRSAAAFTLPLTELPSLLAGNLQSPLFATGLLHE